MHQLLKLVTSLLAGMLLFIGILFGSVSATQALADVLTPEAARYEIDRSHNPQDAARTIQKRSSDYTANDLPRDTQYTTQAIKNRMGDLQEKSQDLSDRAHQMSDEASDKAQNKLKDLGDNIREKLNLDEPLPQSTKDFLHGTKENVDNATAPVTGKGSGYYSQPH